MLHNGYWLFEFLSISQILREAPASYDRSFLYTETDDNDLTYLFLLTNCALLNERCRPCADYIERKTRQFDAIDQVLKSAAFNHRQRALLSHALRHPRHRYTIHGHRNSHNVVYQTARTDLLALQKSGLLDAAKWASNGSLRQLKICRKNCAGCEAQTLYSFKVSTTRRTSHHLRPGHVKGAQGQGPTPRGQANRSQGQGHKILDIRLALARAAIIVAPTRGGSCASMTRPCTAAVFAP